MIDVHFGAGNIGRGFIGETLASNGIFITFVDVNKKVIDALNQRGSYEVELADEGHKKILVDGVNGINNASDPGRVVSFIAKADMVTTAIGPKILPIIAPLIADGIKARRIGNNKRFMDVIACENMIGGSQFLKERVYNQLTNEEKVFADEYIGFPNAAVDRIVPVQHHQDPLAVSVEPFKEWVIDASQMKNHDMILEGVEYAQSLDPYIERKLFSVNTGHATVAYTGKYLGYDTIGEAIADPKVLRQLEDVLKETGELLITKWDLDPDQHHAYQQKIIERFENPYISDDISRVGRTPIRKLGYDERFIRPIRELKERGLDYSALLNTVGMVLTFFDSNDEESQTLRDLFEHNRAEDVVRKITELKDNDLIAEIVLAYQNNVLSHQDIK